MLKIMDQQEFIAKSQAMNLLVKICEDRGIWQLSTVANTARSPSDLSCNTQGVIQVKCKAECLNDQNMVGCVKYVDISQICDTAMASSITY